MRPHNVYTEGWPRFLLNACLQNSSIAVLNIEILQVEEKEYSQSLTFCKNWKIKLCAFSSTGYIFLRNKPRKCSTV